MHDAMHAWVYPGVDFTGERGTIIKIDVCTVWKKLWKKSKLTVA